MTRPSTVSRQEALRLILSSTHPLGIITLPLLEACGHVAGDDYHAAEPIPLFDRSGVDGYAIRYKDAAGAAPEQPAKLRVVGQISPGTTPSFSLDAGQAARITTGGALPPGADAVVKEEDVRCESELLELTRPVTAHRHVRKKGGDLKQGTRIVSRRQPITPSIISLLASLRIEEVSVIRKPEVSIISVGDELTELHDGANSPKIVASNLYMLSALVRRHGGRLKHTRICGDDRGSIRREVEQGLEGDMIVTTGGASNARSDLTRSLLAHMEIDFKFVGLAMRPGKWTTFGLYQDRPVFCLSGTPSAVYVGFHLFVLPALLKQMGHASPGVPSVEAVLEEGIQKRSGLEHVVQGVLGNQGDQYRVQPLTGPGVQVFSAMAQSNALVFVNASHGTLEAGETVLVQPLNPFGPHFPEVPAGKFDLPKKSQTDSLPPIVSIVGKSDAGKTTLLEKLVPELTNRGYRVGTIKHDVHGFDIDHEGKDSWRHKQAGACTVVISSPRKVAVVRDVDEEERLDNLVTKYFRDTDIVITEGYKREAKRKIEIFRSEVHDSPLCMDDENLVAIVSDDMIDLQVPRFGLEDIAGLADLIEARFSLRSNQAIRQHLV